MRSAASPRLVQRGERAPDQRASGSRRWRRCGDYAELPLNGILCLPSQVMVKLVLLVYVAGVAWGLLRTDARPPARVALALAWPLGPMAFGATLAILFFASHVAFPLFGMVSMTVAAAVWWVFG